MYATNTDPTDVSSSTWDTTPHTILSTKFGFVDARFVGNDQVMAQVCDESGRQAHINDDVPGLTYRGQRYIGAPRFVLGPAGFVACNESYDTLKNDAWKSAPATYNAAMVEAVRDALTVHLANVDPSAVARGNLAHLRNNLRRALEQETEARTALESATANCCAVRIAIRDAADEVGPDTTKCAECRNYVSVGSPATAHAVGCSSR